MAAQPSVTAKRAAKGVPDALPPRPYDTCGRRHLRTHQIDRCRTCRCPRSLVAPPPAATVVVLILILIVSFFSINSERQWGTAVGRASAKIRGYERRADARARAKLTTIRACNTSRIDKPIHQAPSQSCIHFTQMPGATVLNTRAMSWRLCMHAHNAFHKEKSEELATTPAWGYCRVVGYAGYRYSQYAAHAALARQTTQQQHSGGL